MLPFIIGGAVAAVTFFKKPKCTVCESRLTWNQDCIFCHAPVCGDCGTEVKQELYRGQVIAAGGRCCAKHLRARTAATQEKVDEVDKYFHERETQVAKMRQLLDAAEAVETYPKTYKGMIPAAKLGKTIQSAWVKDKQTAEHDLKVAAARECCPYIVGVEFIKRTEEEGNYKFSTWQATGRI